MFSDYSAPHGLPAGAENLSQAHDPDDRVDPEEFFNCRFCDQKLLHKKSLRRHEQGCRAPGGPKHEFPEDCLDPDSCVGQKDYTPRPDGRIGNSKGKRGPKPKKNKKA